MIKTLQENNVLFSTLWTNIQYYCICGPSCPQWAELYGYPRRLPRFSLDREFDARSDWVVALIVITGGVQKGPKDASAFAFPTLNS